MASELFPSVASPIRERDPEKRLSGGLVRSQTLSSNRHDHPYLIRTTSSSLLTRSNSVGSTHKPHQLAAVAPPSPALGRSQGRGHKHSKSQTFVPPPPLPLASPDRAESSLPLTPSPAKETPRRLKRSDTLPSISSKPPESPFKIEDLPNNPKVWTSSHLATYLSSALRLKGGGSLPVPVIRDIATFVVAQKLNGRVFLRLTPHELEEMGMNQLWRPAMLNASRALRQNVVQGRIWGFGQAAEEVVSSPGTSTPSSATTKHASLPSVPTTVFEDYLDELAERGAVSSEPEDKHEGAGWIARGMLSSSMTSSTSGRVKGMVASFERAASGSSISDNSADEEGATPSPFDFDSPPAEADITMSPVPALSILDEEPSEEIHLPITIEPPTDGESELTSGSEAGDEDENDDGAEEGDVTTIAEHHDEDGCLKEAREQEDVECDSSPTPSILPQTPPPVYAQSDPGVGAPDSDVEDAALHMPLPASPLQGRSPSSTIVLTTGRRKPGYVAHITKDSGSDDTIENLIANFNSAENPLTASWGANAWLESPPDGATARKIHEQLTGTVSISRSRGSKMTSGKRGGHEPKRPSLSGLFDDASMISSSPSVTKSTSEVEVDATSNKPSLADSQLVAELREKHAQQEVLLEEFRARLEEVERKLEEMEERDAIKDPIAPVAIIEPTMATKVDRAVSPTPHVGDSDEPKSSLDMSEAPQTTIDPASEEDEWQDPTFGELPTYVFMIGLGVCAIAMRVMIKKVVGKKASLLPFV